jgi:23S rRNA (cytidine1920-2'-O)/16S rRNA (cytidine1409-2'-O)-methyltransferase
MKKERLDVLLFSRGLVKSRETARGVILSGSVFVDGERIDKAGTAVKLASEIVIAGEQCPYVSRGGLKLAHAIKAFCIDLSQKIAIDVGASTGGFTDCLLQHGAARVYAVDVGYGQLAEALRQDARVVVLDRQNIRHLNKEAIPQKADIVTIDVSFISLTKVIPEIVNLLIAGGEIVALVKPQFEVGKGEVGTGGIVRNPEQHQTVLDSIINRAKEWGLCIKGTVPSPMTGKKGNKEFLVYFQRGN